MKRDIVKILLLYVVRQKVEQGEDLCIWEQLAYAGKHTLTTAKVWAPIVYDGDSCAAVHQVERLLTSMRPKARDRGQFVPAHMMHVGTPPQLVCLQIST
ncbi:hypothetical protein [Sinorhizobium meliloti]|uniref:hypothetical protein n=1 Tax=Rhizobium meliloti TaxID=382 RepID=UPI003F5CE800